MLDVILNELKMENKNYWVCSLEELFSDYFPNIKEIPDQFVKDVMMVAEMQREYNTCFQRSELPLKEEDRKLKNEINKLNKDIEVYREFIEKLYPSSSVSIQNGRVDFYYRR